MKIRLYPSDYDPLVTTNDPRVAATPEEVKAAEELEKRSEIVEVDVDSNGDPMVPCRRWFSRLDESLS